MEILVDTFNNTGTIHHAYFIEGERESALAGLKKFLEEDMDIQTRGNPDVRIVESENFSIDESRALGADQLGNALSGKKIFITTLRNMTGEAQNALLKIFEEPTPNTHFFIIAPTSRILLPTLRSRMVVISHESNASNADLEKKVKDFLKSGPAERLATVKIIADEKDKGAALQFVQAIEKQVAKSEKKNAAALEAIVTAEKYLHDRAPSLKLILEHLSLVLPKI